MNSFIQTLKYKWSINLQDGNSLIRDALFEMESFADSGQDCWLTRVKKIEQLFNIQSFNRYCKSKTVETSMKKRVRSLFDRFLA